MESKFNLYDLLAYGIPGFGVLLLIWLGLQPVVPEVRLEALAGAEIIVAIVVFFASYILGHLLQSLRRQSSASSKVIARWIEAILFLNPGGGTFRRLRAPPYSRELLTSEELLAEWRRAEKTQGRRDFLGDSERFDPQLRQRLSDRLGRHFGLDMMRPEAMQNAWELARAELVQQGRAGHAELYNSLAQLYAGLSLLFGLSITAAIGIMGVHLAEQGFDDRQWTTAALLFVPAAALRISAPLMRHQYHALLRLFAKGVHLSWYALDCARRPAAGEGGGVDE